MNRTVTLARYMNNDGTFEQFRISESGMPVIYVTALQEDYARLIHMLNVHEVYIYTSDRDGEYSLVQSVALSNLIISYFRGKRGRKYDLIIKVINSNNQIVYQQED